MSRPQFRKQTTTPEDAQKIAAHAQRHLPCSYCGAAPGEPCPSPGRGKTVHASRFTAAAIEVRRQAKAARLTPEQAAANAAILATLPRVPREEIESCKTERGGYAFTKERLAAWGVPWPPPPGWRQALQRDEDSTSGANPDPETRTTP